MRANVIKSLSLPLVILGIICLLAVSQSVMAAPPDTPDKAIDHIAKKAGVTLEKQASTELVPLGHVVSYTVTIKNDVRKNRIDIRIISKNLSVSIPCLYYSSKVSHLCLTFCISFLNRFSPRIFSSKGSCLEKNG